MSIRSAYRPKSRRRDHGQDAHATADRRAAFAPMGSRENKLRRSLPRILSAGLGGLLIAASLLTLWSEVRNRSFANKDWVRRPVVMMPVAIVEEALGIFLVAGLYRRSLWFVTIGVFSLFAIVTAFEAISGEDSCNCFGAVNVRPIYTMFLDLVAVAALLCMSCPSREETVKSGARRWAVAGAVALLWVSTITVIWITKPAMAAGAAFGKPGDSIILEPSQWVGQTFSLTKHIDIGSSLGRGRWVVLLVRHDCRHCAGAVQQCLASVSARQDQPRLAVIEMAPYSDTDDPAFWDLPKSVASGRLDQTRDWVVTTPVVIVIQDGMVIAGVEGDAAENPDPRWFAN
jgi:hypothetical protein